MVIRDVQPFSLSYHQKQSLQRVGGVAGRGARRRRLRHSRRDPLPQLRDLLERVSEPLARLVTVLLRAEELGTEVEVLVLKALELGHSAIATSPDVARRP